MCDLAYVIEPHIQSIFQLMNVVIPEYNIQMLTTKCLSTAVIILYLLAGKFSDGKARGLAYTRFCDVDKVRGRDSTCSMSYDVLTRMENEMFEGSVNGRIIPGKAFYVMFTNGTLPNMQQSNSKSKSEDADHGRPTASFPGHVFVIERITGGSRFNMYQSYITHYNLAQQIKLTKSLSIGRVRMKEIVNSMQLMFVMNPKKANILFREVWDEECTRAWKNVSLVDESRFEGYEVRGQICVCYKSVENITCTGFLKDIVVKGIKDIEKTLDESPAMGGHVFTRPGLTIDLKEPGMTPLTYLEILKELQVIKSKLI